MKVMSTEEAKQIFGFALRRFTRVFGKDNVLFCLYDCQLCVGIGATNAGIDPSSRAGLRRHAVLVSQYFGGEQHHHTFHHPVEVFDLSKFGRDRVAIADQLAGEVFEILCEK